MTGLAQRQEDLVRALVTGAPTPAGFDPTRLRAVEDTLLRKRSGEAARHLPLLCAELGERRFTELFCAWARGRERGGSCADAAAFAAQLSADVAEGHA